MTTKEDKESAAEEKEAAKTAKAEAKAEAKAADKAAEDSAKEVAATKEPNVYRTDLGEGLPTTPAKTATDNETASKKK